MPKTIKKSASWHDKMSAIFHIGDLYIIKIQGVKKIMTKAWV